MCTSHRALSCSWSSPHLFPSRCLSDSPLDSGGFSSSPSQLSHHLSEKPFPPMLPKCPFQHSHHTTPCFSFRGICSHVELCRKEDPFQHPKGGSCLSLGSELSEKTHMLTKQETLLGRGTQAEHRDENPGGLLCLMVCSLRPMVIGLVSGLSLANQSDSGSFLVAPRCSSERILGDL